MKRLPYGITGFHYYLEPPPPITDENTFIALAHSFAQLIGAQLTLTHKIASAPDRNFTAIEFKTDNESFATLMNGHYPLIAFSQPIQFDSLTIEFIDRPEFGKRWQELGEFQILTIDELAIPPHDVDASDISDTEYDQILIHKPSTVGEIIFNFWD
ncbi:hypothetical protein [Blastopirellula marina]|uniref:Uncharacterized protein n=1 Tax=Blastopirellula marina DSM 3645 TaxID=314230 RepID=A3ZSE5_9BACT|nr:hypothetical protein [Blastopirellula marina]EAQ80605.1 hypothetical protein DSM3645_14705 [Blastopirellula marina DSM 3645]